MKISFGSEIKKTAWGGGNQFLINISNYLKLKNIKVVYDLKDHDIDIIVLMDPRVNSSSSTFNHIDIDNYLRSKNKYAIVVHRVNECDERKNTNNVNETLMQANKFSDHTVFISNWLRKLFSKYKFAGDYSVILNGADQNIFNFNEKNNHDQDKKVKIVTHHWSSHVNKGFEIYKYLDSLLNNSSLSNDVEFTFIGNLPKNLNLKKTNCISPRNGIELANLIKQNDIYLTASKNEPGGNHQNEGLNCGLPVLYLDSGCMEEYCKGYGLSYVQENLKEKIFEIKNKYEFFRNKTKNYPYNSQLMCKSYEKLFLKLINNRENIISKRNLPKLTFLAKMKYKLKLNF